MPLNSQTSNFPPLNTFEQSWAENVRKAMDIVHPIPAIASGLKMGFPLLNGQPATGLLPTLTDGMLVWGDRVMGPYGSKLIIPAPINAASNFYFGLKGAYWATVPDSPKDALIASVLTDNGNPASILHIAQLIRSSSGLWGVRGMINLGKVAKGADVPFFTWNKPPTLRYDNLRIAHAQARTAIAVTGGNSNGNDFLLKLGATTLVTLPASGLGAADNIVIGTPGAGWEYDAITPGLTFSYNQAGSGIASGAVEVTVLFEGF